MGAIRDKSGRPAFSKLLAQLTKKRLVLEASVAETTAKRYNAALDKFLKWTDIKNSDATNYDQLDSLLMQYFQDVFEQDSRRGAKQLCTNTRAAVLLYLPGAKHDGLHGSNRLLSAWDRLQPKIQRPPCPYGLMLLMVHWIWKIANRLDIAAVIWICFNGYLRINECLRLTPMDIALPTRTTPGGISLQKTKTGVNQAVVITDSNVWNILERHLATCSTSTIKIFSSITGTTVVDMMKRASHEIGLPDSLQLTPHCLRHGGATHDFLEGRPLTDIVYRGRWACSKSAESYIQAGRSLLLRLHIPKSVQEKMDRFVEEPRRIFDQ